MAKWGEGDPRWLVQERSDGKNVNQWHWEEINKLPWAKKRLAELLVGFRIDDATITSVKEVSGEVPYPSIPFRSPSTVMATSPFLPGVCDDPERRKTCCQL